MRGGSGTELRGLRAGELGVVLAPAPSLSSPPQLPALAASRHHLLNQFPNSPFQLPTPQPSSLPQPHSSSPSSQPPLLNARTPTTCRLLALARQPALPLPSSRQLQSSSPTSGARGSWPVSRELECARRELGVGGLGSRGLMGPGDWGLVGSMASPGAPENKIKT